MNELIKVFIAENVAYISWKVEEFPINSFELKSNLNSFISRNGGSSYATTTGALKSKDLVDEARYLTKTKFNMAHPIRARHLQDMITRGNHHLIMSTNKTDLSWKNIMEILILIEQRELDKHTKRLNILNKVKEQLK